jgi:glyoxylase-like metal-dependent hydrolase (beta-lactamase superfamily II)
VSSKGERGESEPRSAGQAGAAPASGFLAEEDGEAEMEQVALASAQAAGIHRLAIPTPFQVGRVNAYLIEDDPLTLVDSGPNSGKALDEMEQALASHGRRIEEIGLLIITHQHIDHFGLAAILARRSGAEVTALSQLGPYLERFGEQADEDDAYAQAIMRRHGIPPDVVTALRAVSGSFRGWGAKVTVTQPLTDGQQLTLRDRTLRVLHRPGHSPSDTVFHDQQRKMLIAGDHLLKHISSNPLISRPLGAPPDYSGPRPKALVAYIESLRQTAKMDLELVLCGHGGPVTDHEALIEERLRMHARRAEKIHKLISEQPRTAHEIAQKLWGNVAVTQAYLTLSEVLGHVDLLLDGGEVSEAEVDSVVRFEAPSS